MVRKISELLVLGFLCTACYTIPEEAWENSYEDVRFDQLPISDDFLFETAENKTLRFQTQSATGERVAFVPLSLYKGLPGSEGALIARGISDVNGECSFSPELPSYLDTVYLTIEYLGFPELYKIALKKNRTQPFLIGTNLTDPDIYSVQSAPSNTSSRQPANKRFAATYVPKITYTGAFNAQGRPEYLLPESESINSDKLLKINNALPSHLPVASLHPQYLEAGKEKDLLILRDTEVRIAFLHESVASTHSLAYYSYPLDKPPLRVEDISALRVVFPNASYKGYGGDLRTGDKVSLGYFPAGTGIGFCLLPEAWNPVSNSVSVREPIRFASPALNVPENAQFAVVLNDPTESEILLGFRDGLGPDSVEDVNELVFLVETTEYESIQVQSLAVANSTAKDSDGDGVPDNLDGYPLESNQAFTEYSPAENVFGTLLFEDFWPQRGDYDLNDMVIKYRYRYLLNGSGKVTKIEAVFKLEAMGAGYRNGFGFQLDVAPTVIAKVSGSILTENIVKLDEKGLERGQRKAVIILFENGYRVLARSPGGLFANTEPYAAYVTPKETPISITFATPVSKSELGLPPHNPFIFTEFRRGHEIHLPDKEPTDLADKSLFRTSDDTSDPAKNRYYKTRNNIMWALHIPEEFRYTKESASILQAYTRMKDWALESGGLYQNWYKDPKHILPGYLYP